VNSFEVNSIVKLMNLHE